MVSYLVLFKTYEQSAEFEEFTNGHNTLSCSICSLRSIYLFLKEKKGSWL